MRYRCPRRRERRSGVAVAELAVLLPFLVFTFSVAIDYCRVFYVTQVVQNCAYAGALYASQTATSSSGPQAAAQQAAVAEGTNLNPPLTAGQVSYTPPDAKNQVKVSVSYDFCPITRFLGIPSTVTITRSATMVVSP